MLADKEECGNRSSVNSPGASGQIALVFTSKRDLGRCLDSVTSLVIAHIAWEQRACGAILGHLQHGRGSRGDKEQQGAVAKNQERGVQGAVVTESVAAETQSKAPFLSGPVWLVGPLERAISAEPWDQEWGCCGWAGCGSKRRLQGHSAISTSLKRSREKYRLFKIESSRAQMRFLLVME